VQRWLATAHHPRYGRTYDQLAYQPMRELLRHLRANGFRVKPVAVEDTAVARKRLGIPEKLGGCHTALIEGYAIEGHVPAREIRRLLAERPLAAGLSVPGMPQGSPGMESGKAQPYDVLLVDKSGGHTVYARYGR
jgi:hypothetical protein